MSTVVQLHDCGLIHYQDALDMQTNYFQQMVSNKLNAVSNENNMHLIVCEHSPVITLGKSGKQTNLLLQKELLQQKGIEFFETNRGGDITFHGPEQIVMYPILDLDFFITDVKQYMRNLESIAIQTLQTYNIEGERLEQETGVWVKQNQSYNKICAFGVKMSRWITMHGLALNVNTNLDFFNYIVPCGIADKGVTSMQKELNQTIDKTIVKEQMINNFIKIFNCNIKC